MQTSREVVLRTPNGKTVWATLVEPASVGFSFYCTDPYRGELVVVKLRPDTEPTAPPPSLAQGELFGG